MFFSSQVRTIVLLSSLAGCIMLSSRPGFAQAPPNLVLVGENEGDAFGYSVSSAGDVNGDGFHDIIVGANRNSAGGDLAGRAYVYSGEDGSLLFTITGENEQDHFGQSVSTAGDFNGDGFQDVIVGAPGFDPSGQMEDWGRVYVFLGSPNPTSLSAGSAAFIATGEAVFDGFGDPVSWVGDLNADGFDDIVAGAPGNDAGGLVAGRAYAFYGRPASGASISASNADFIFTGSNDFVEFGWAVSGAGDVNLDGYDDVLIGSPSGLVGSQYSGNAFVYSGNNAALLYTFLGESGRYDFGQSVSAGGDVNGDGIPDVLVGASNRGFVFLGRSGPFPIQLTAMSADIIANTSGTSVSIGGDLNSDGLDDFAVRRSVFLGSRDGFPVQFEVTDAAVELEYGRRVAFSKDLNGDRSADLITGVSGSLTDPGWAYIYWMDQDGDGLLDSWELSGIPTSQGPYLLEGADPEHKDIYLELDAMLGHEPDPLALQAIVTAFAEVPDSLLLPRNPDGNPGINLHITGPGCEPCINEVIPAAVWSGVDGNSWPNDFKTTKTAHFGTPVSEQGDVSILHAKSKAYRYGIVAQTLANETRLGQGEIPGNDFYILLGMPPWRDSLATPMEQAGLLMHELGHTLGLNHSGDGLGGKPYNFKPNYYSVMNYLWTTPARIRLPGVAAQALSNYHDSWVLDYSRSSLPTLRELALEEERGLGGSDSVWVPVGPPLIQALGCIPGPILLPEIVRMGGAVNWNRNSGIDVGTTVCADANFIFGISGGSGGSPGQELSGWNDWRNLNYLPVASEKWELFPDGQAQPKPRALTEEIDVITYDILEQLGSMRFDCNGNQIPDDEEIGSLQVLDQNGNGIPDECETSAPVPVSLSVFSVRREGQRVVVVWEVDESRIQNSFHVFRQVENQRSRLTDYPLSNRPAYEFVDDAVPPGTVEYWLEELGRNGDRSWHGPVSVSEATPADVLVLFSPRPNPASHGTDIGFFLPESRRVRVAIHDVTGRLIATIVDQWLEEGEHFVSWNGDRHDGLPLASGIYLVRLTDGRDVVVRKLVVLKP